MVNHWTNVLNAKNLVIYLIFKFLVFFGSNCLANMKVRTLELNKKILFEINLKNPITKRLRRLKFRR